MLKEIIDFIKNNYPTSNIDDWLNSKYIKLTNSQLKKIAQAIKSGELQHKNASYCTVDNIIFHFGDTLVLLKKINNSSQVYQAELAWHTNFQSIHSTRHKDKGFYFINFSFDDNFKITMLDTKKKLPNSYIDIKANTKIANNTMLVLKGFMYAIST